MHKTIYISDFDDTLVKTKSIIRVTDVSGNTRELTPAQYAVYEKKPGDQFDYSDFDDLIDPVGIPRYIRTLKRAISSKKIDKVVILTARGSERPISKFLQSVGIVSGVKIVALGNSDPEHKKEYLRKQLQQGYTRMAFADDSEKNIRATKELRSEFPNAAIIAHHVKPPVVEIRPIQKKSKDMNQADEWVSGQHYLKKWPRAVQAVLGVYVDGKLSGTVVYGIGTRGQAATDIFGKGIIRNNQLWELQRLFTTDDAKKLVPNLGSMVISRGNEFIRTRAKTKDGKPVKAIVSYADSAQGHSGSVYRSTNAIYLGQQPPRKGWAVTNIETGNTVFKSTLRKNARETFISLGHVVEPIVPESGRHKFLYVLGKDQKERDALLMHIKKPIFSYPRPGEPSRQIENPVQAQKSRSASQVQPQSKIAKIKHFLRGKMKTQDGEEILIQTAYKNKEHPMHMHAVRMVHGFAKKNNIRLNQQ
jgi:hypothetical protein